MLGRFQEPQLLMSCTHSADTLFVTTDGAASNNTDWLEDTLRQQAPQSKRKESRVPQRCCPLRLIAPQLHHSASPATISAAGQVQAGQCPRRQPTP